MKRVVFALLSCFVSQTVLAWGQTGHRITGEIAQQFLDPIASTYIAQLIPNESLAEASTWADEMRSNPRDFWKKTAGPFHYVTVPKNRSYLDVGAPDKGDSVTALQRFRNTLLDENSSMENKQLALRFIVHIIGDLHQPLHAGDGTDRGGNDVKVRFMWEDSNLHRVWDSGLINHQQLSFKEWTSWLTEKLDASNVAKWHSTNPSIWITESAAIRDTIYPQDANNMSWNYVYEHTPTVKQRLSQGGVRIALYLNELFGELARKTNP